MKPANMDKQQFIKFLKKNNWNKEYHYCTKTITFTVDDKIIAKVEYDVIRKVSKFFVGKELK